MARIIKCDFCGREIKEVSMRVDYERIIFDEVHKQDVCEECGDKIRELCKKWAKTDKE